MTSVLYMGAKLTNETTEDLIWKVPVVQILMLARENVFSLNEHAMTLSDKELIDGIE